MEQHYNKRTVITVMSILLLIGAIFLGIWIIHNLLYVSTDDAQVKGNLVGVASKVSARVTFLGAEEGDTVKQGQVLARLDDTDLSASLEEAQASAEAARLDYQRFSQDISINEKQTEMKLNNAGDTLESTKDRLDISQEDLAMQEETARANLKKQEAVLKSAKSKYTQSKAEFEEADRDAKRATQLYKQGAISQQANDQASTRLIAAQSGVDSASENVSEQARLLDIANSQLRTIKMKKSQYETSRNDLSSSGRNLEIAKLETSRIDVQRQNLKVLAAKLKEAEAKVEYQMFMVGETIVKSPVMGSVARRNINLGETTSPGAPLFYVLDMSIIWVVANVEEGSIRYIHPGSKAILRVDSYPNKPFKGTVEFVGTAASSEFSLFPSDNPAGNFIKVTHRIPVRVKIDDPEHLLKPGMNVVVDISKK